LKRYLIIGNGVAGARAAIKIREIDPKGEIHVFTDEAYPFYYRVRFPEFIAKEITVKDITIHSLEYYQEKKIYLHLEEAITNGNIDRKEVISDSGKIYNFDILLIATGGNAFVPQIKGVEKKGVFTLRKMKDAIRMKEFADNVKQAILIGGGLVGLETGWALLRRGIKVAVIEHNLRILPRQMDEEGAKILQSKMEAMGFSFFLNAQTEAIIGGDNVEGIILKDGRLVDGEMVIISAGVRPNIDLAKSMGIKVNNGIIVNDLLETEKEDIFAAGDVAEHRGRCYGIWPAAQRQGEIAGINMAGGNIIYGGTVVSNKLKILGIDLTSSGEIDVENKYEHKIKVDSKRGIYKKIVLRDDKIIGCILLGEKKGDSDILNAIEKQINVREVKDFILEENFDFNILK
jgi:nitrite reductase (NADH) large subunit